MEADREKFRAWVEKSGLMSTLTNVLVKLYEEPDKPQDPIKFVKDLLGTASVDQKQVQILQERVKELEEENEALKERLITAESKTKDEKSEDSKEEENSQS